MKLTETENPAPRSAVNKTTHRTFTRRGVLWLGQTCNLHCQFCYFIDKIHSKGHPEHPFMIIDKAKKICKTLVEFYGNNSIDIQGGEPTLYKDIFDLIQYCKEIGLTPSLITNALVLDDIKRCLAFKDAGIRDFLVSVHGLGDVFDALVGVKGAHVCQMKALRNLQEAGIPFRFNCVLTKLVLHQLPLIAELAKKTGARVVNFITFNPFADQSQKGRRNIQNVPRYSEVSGRLNNALDILNDSNIEANVRYFPICMAAERHRKSVYNFQQLPYDHHEWDYASWAWTGLQPQRMKKGDVSDPVQPSTSRWFLHLKEPLKKLSEISGLSPILYKAHKLVSQRRSPHQAREEIYREIAKIHAEVHCKYKYGKKCLACVAQDICDGFHGDYAAMFGTEEARPIQGDVRITDPLYYIRNQEKTVEREDEDWALQP
ncbi:MAG: hypothetical protein A2Y81_10505 [Nitrospirae bacterium RBG_13_43_8]|nr:MAG: hypothetical protein A2Y81_10505 [Nitrospirae bacterium RBG_13_43_8]